MFKILTLNNISVAGLEKLPRDKYEVASEMGHPDAILLRSFKMHDMEIPSTLKAVGRAGAGVNNIPVDTMSAQGIPVFNAPGANANAVKELVLAGMLIGYRHLMPAWDFARHLEGSDEEISKQVEAGKKHFSGFELPGKTLGVVGLGAIGRHVANMAISLGMNVIGFDPGITVEGAWKLSSDVKQAQTIDEMLPHVDFISFHVPLVEATKNMLNKERIKLMKKEAIIINFARNGIIDDEAVSDALNADLLYGYVCDFPSNLLKQHKKVVTFPHLGASTKEAEDNCATMVVDNLRDYLENGNIRYSVNFPEVHLSRTSNVRLAIANSNVPNMVGQISTLIADAGINIIDMINKSRQELAYTLVDIDGTVSDEILEKLRAIEGVLSVRLC